MNIVSTQYNLSNKALEIYLSGCYGDCYGCHNPELKDFSIGNYYKEELSKLTNKINDFYFLINSIWILGGEPLDQNYNELFDLLLYLKQFNKNIWLFTRYEIEEISDEIIEYCDYIKTGKYIDELKVDDNIQCGIKLATSNQKVYKI